MTVQSCWPDVTVLHPQGCVQCGCREVSGSYFTDEQAAVARDAQRLLYVYIVRGVTLTRPSGITKTTSSHE
ncbi:hypothetical protein AG1IA_08083 [Rhizoctonia solani AG-1 IA]|uniref:Uncharacterized protein n=1 Tax=Thanatephorus cucumeris (strain AG1-IA) TaxID=983506 RepID=L8WIZ6_THACA|nr:hypothetical protein AG1IA_08083 [Rhizoctonia solani AG-1 IA]